ncbi:hypothetical protein JB92DRAFT_2642081, partial [Gautieria morchelliformis]
PKVLAANGFLSWLTPFGITQIQSESLILPHKVNACRLFVITQAVKPATLSTYSSGLLCFTKFCDDYHIPENNHMPALELLLATFITTQGAGSVSGSTIASWLAGVQLWHTTNGAPWNSASLLKHAVEGSSRLAPKSSTCAKHDPVTLQHIKCLCHLLNLTNTLDAAIYSVACIAFWSCCRFSELLIDMDFNSSQHVSCSCTIKCGVTANGPPSLTFHIPSSKTQGTRGADI